VFTVRTVTAGDNQKPVNMRDVQYPTKRVALDYIRGLGELVMIRRMGKLYIVQPKKK